MLLSAVLFDVDGTIVETEELHRKSFNESFKEFNLDWFWDRPIYKELINIGGGKERIEHYMKRAWPEMLEYKNLSKYINSIHKVKNEIYEDYINESNLKFRPGVLRLIKELKDNNIRIALVSSSSEMNVNNLLKKGLKIKPDNDSVKASYDNHSEYHEGDSGLDLFVQGEVVVPAKSLGFKIDMMISCEAFRDPSKQGGNISYYLWPRSSMGAKTPLRLSNSMGLIDAGYRGNIIALVDVVP